MCRFRHARQALDDLFSKDIVASHQRVAPEARDEVHRPLALGLSAS
jgi:hypothetical protein